MNAMHYNGLDLDRIAVLANKRHPLTGELLHPLGRRANGRLNWPIMGGSDDAGSDKDGEGSKDSDKDSDSKDKEGSGNSGGSEEEKGKDKDKDEGDKEKPKPESVEARLAALEDEKERHYRLRKEAEDRAEKAEKEAKELREKDLPAAEKLQKDLDEAKNDNETLSASLKQTMLEKAFLEDNTYSWHNPSRALKIADLSRVEFDNDGKVRGLKDALKSLATSDPYLIKQEEKPGNDDDKDKAHKSGDQKNNKNKNNSDSTDKKRAELVAKYPGLRR